MPDAIFVRGRPEALGREPASLLFLTLDPWSGIPCAVSQPALKQLESAHDHHDDEHAPSTDELGPDEPRTPGWLTAVGGVLFMIVAVWFIASRAATPAQEAPSPQAEQAQQ